MWVVKCYKTHTLSQGKLVAAGQPNVLARRHTDESQTSASPLLKSRESHCQSA